MNKEKIISFFKWFFHSFIWVGILLLVVDIVTKLVVSANKEYILSQSDQGIKLIPGFLAINYVENANAAFGLGFKNPEINRWLYVAAAVIGAALIITYYIFKRKQLNNITKICLMLMAGGAIGNLIDRLFYSFSNFCVIDWINFYGIWGYNFNIADSGVVCGTLILVVYMIVVEVLENRKKDMEDFEKQKAESALNETKSKEISEDDSSK